MLRREVRDGLRVPPKLNMVAQLHIELNAYTMHTTFGINSVTSCNRKYYLVPLLRSLSAQIVLRPSSVTLRASFGL